MNAEAAAALASEPDLFQMGGALVSVAALAESEADAARIVRRPAGLPTVRPVPPALLAERLTRSARFVEEKMRRGQVTREPCHPPVHCVRAVHERGDWPAVRRLDALLPYPAFLADGRVLSAPGYDPATGLYLADAPPLAVPDRPTPAQARAAAAELLDLVADFPFAGPEHRTAWLAALLTPLAWFAFDGPAPLFVTDGNTPGAGKGKLLHVIALILTGRPFPVSTYDNDPAETKKVITTLAVEADTLVLFDNLAGAVGNAHLDAALTAERWWKGRVLGASRTYDGPLNVTFYASGNNVQFAGDTPRRVCQIRLETEYENPEERADFRHPKLIEHVRANRPRLLAAALTVLRGWHAAGRPSVELPEWGTFERWGAVVRQAVVWAGLADPGEARLGRAAGGDPDRENLAAVLAGSRRLDPDRQGLTAGAVVKALKSPDAGDELGELRAAVEEQCGKLDAKRLGQLLRKNMRRNVGGWMIDRDGITDGAVRWKAVRVATADPDPSPSSPSPPSATPFTAAGEGGEGMGGVGSSPAGSGEINDDIPW